MRRRDVLAALGGAAAMPLAVRAQERIRRIGVLMGYAEEDPEAKLRLAAFVQRLASLGWDQGRNLAMDVDGPRATSTRQRSSRKNWLGSATGGQRTPHP